MAVESTLYQTARKELLDEYAKRGVRFAAYTRPYKSTLQLQLQAITEPNAAGVTFLVAQAGQRLEWFSYGVGEPIPYGRSGATRVALEDDTNVSKGRNTNGVEDFVIEGMSLTHSRTRIDYNTTVAGFTNAFTNSALGINGAQPQVPVIDPAAILAPPQVQSPLNLEDALWTAIAPLMSIEFEWDRSRVIKIGTADEIGEGGPKSFLRANGDPRPDARYKIPEGYVWRRQGQPDSEFIVRGVLQDPIFVPVTNLALPIAEAAALPIANVFLDLTFRLHGLAVTLPTRN